MKYETLQYSPTRATTSLRWWRGSIILNQVVADGGPYVVIIAHIAMVFDFAVDVVDDRAIMIAVIVDFNGISFFVLVRFFEIDSR